MVAATLLIDIGNTRIKWVSCLESLGQPQAQLHQTVANKSMLFETMWGQLPQPSQVWVANVAGVAMADALTHWIQQRWHLTAHWAISAKNQCGIVNTYDYPEQLGVDRWLAVVAARQVVATGQICVVDCGTAITVDVVTCDNHYIGGLIAPSQTTLQQVLLQQTAALTDLLQQPTAPVHLVATNTTDGIHWGGFYATVGLIRYVMEQLQPQAPTTLLLTGGGAPELLPYLPESTRYIPALVLQGLWTVANSSLEPSFSASP
jgi:type III pantothenate kinase